jgi:N-dimethylarginine dimethylaminohydrolase
MYHITIRPDTFTINPQQKNQSLYLQKIQTVNTQKAFDQHNEITKGLNLCVTYGLNKKSDLPDIVFTSNMGLSLPRLPEPVVILSWMKYEQRRNETPYIEDIFKERHIKYVQFPGSAKAPFEGMAEAKWFDGGELLVVGYGHRATKASVRILRSLLKDIYETYGVQPPRVVSFQVQSPLFYHLDMAMLVFGPTECIIHKSAFSGADIARLRSELGERNVYVLETDDSFCLNALIEGDTLYTHKLSDPTVKSKLEKITGRAVTEIDTSEFEKSGGSVRCLVFDVFDPRMIKRKRSQTNLAVSSPKA